MTSNISDADYVSAPDNYADLFEQYHSLMVNLFAYFGIDENNREDVASAHLLRFMERNSLEKFDPNLTFEYRGAEKKARFRSYLSRSIELHSRGARDKQNLLKHRELQIADTSFHADTIDSPNTGSVTNHTPWIDWHGDTTEDHAERIHDTMAEAQDAQHVRALLANVPRRNSHDRCDLVALYDAVRAQVLAYGEYDIKVLKDHFGVSNTAMNSWMWWLKANLAHIYGIPLPPKRPRRTRCKHNNCTCTETPEP